MMIGTIGNGKTQRTVPITEMVFCSESSAEIYINHGRQVIKSQSLIGELMSPIHKYYTKETNNMYMTNVTCNIDGCGKTFPEELKEVHYQQAHEAGIKASSLEQMTANKDEAKKVNLIEPEVKTEDKPKEKKGIFGNKSKTNK